MKAQSRSRSTSSKVRKSKLQTLITSKNQARLSIPTSLQARSNQLFSSHQARFKQDSNEGSIKIEKTQINPTELLNNEILNTHITKRNGIGF